MCFGVNLSSLEMDQKDQSHFGYIKCTETHSATVNAVNECEWMYVTSHCILPDV